MSESSVLQHNKRILQDLKEGDLVEFPGHVYSHWAVYIGKEEIVHLTGRLSSSGSSETDKGNSSCTTKTGKAGVVKEALLEAAKDCKVKKNNNKDRRCTPLPAREIVARAKAWIGRRGYNLLKWNCETFTSFIRYDINWSEQVDTAAVYVLSTCAVAAVGGLVAEFVASCLGYGVVVGAAAGFSICFFVRRMIKSANSLKNN